MTIEELTQVRRDLERRLRIDIAQFEQDTGLEVGHVGLYHSQTVGQTRKALIDVEVRLELPR